MGDLSRDEVMMNRTRNSYHGASSFLSLTVFLAFIVIVVIGVVHAHKSHRRHKKGGKQYSLVYRDSQGRRYVKSHDDSANVFEYWVFEGDGGSSPASRESWQRISSLPARLEPTKEVVEEENGEPTSVIEEESAVPEDEMVVEEATTENDVEAAESPGSDSGGDSDGGVAVVGEGTLRGGGSGAQADARTARARTVVRGIMPPF